MIIGKDIKISEVGFPISDLLERILIYNFRYKVIAFRPKAYSFFLGAGLSSPKFKV